VLINTSGSGKTRLLLDGLCHHWGFYFVAKQDVAGIGSTDFWDLMQQLDDSLDYRLAKQNKENDPAAYAHIGEKTHRRLLQLLLARLYLLNLFREEAEGLPDGPDAMVCRRTWVLLQAMPTALFKVDPFLQLADLLSFSSVGDLKARIQEQYDLVEEMLEFGEDISDGRKKRRPLYIVIDESQLLTKQRLGEYKSDDGRMMRGLLRQVWLSIFEALKTPKVLLVLSGTGIDYKALEDTLTSPAFKLVPYAVVQDIGAFDDPESQANYIKQYLPSVGDVFIKRAWAWCRGRYANFFSTGWSIMFFFITRYRSTAALIVAVLMYGHQSPNRVLNEYVTGFTNYTPTDYQWDAEKEPPIPNAPKRGPILLNFDGMSTSSALTYLYRDLNKCFGPQANNRRRH
jgi:hypothetical protein